MCKGQQYELDKLSQREIAELLLSIEDVRHTKMIDCDALHKVIDEYNKKRRKEIESFLFNSGYSIEELLAVLSTQQDDTSVGFQRSKTNSIIQGKPYVVTSEGRIIQENTGRKTYIAAIREIGAEKVYDAWQDMGRSGGIEYGFRQGFKRQDCVQIDDGFFLYVNITHEKMYERLQHLIRYLHLDWTIAFEHKEKKAYYLPKGELISKSSPSSQKSAIGIDEQFQNDEKTTVPQEEYFCNKERCDRKGFLKQEIKTKIQKDLGIGERRARDYGKLFCEKFGGQVRSITNIRASYTAAGEVCVSYTINNRRYRLNLGSESPYVQLKNMKKNNE